MRLSIDDHSDPLDLDVVDKHLHPKVPWMEMRGLEMEQAGAGMHPSCTPQESSDTGSTGSSGEVQLIRVEWHR